MMMPRRRRTIASLAQHGAVEDQKGVRRGHGWYVGRKHVGG
jgi:hypothetical protein